MKILTALLTALIFPPVTIALPISVHRENAKENNECTIVSAKNGLKVMDCEHVMSSMSPFPTDFLGVCIIASEFPNMWVDLKRYSKTYYEKRPDEWNKWLAETAEQDEVNMEL